MATNIKSTTIASSYDRLVLIEDGATISSGTSTVNVEIQTPSGVATATPLHISTDRIGIGTATPDYLLDVENASGHSHIRVLAGTDSSAQLLLQNDAQIWNINCQTGDKFAIYDDTDNVERLVIDTDGKVGIGTTSPYALLELGSTSDEDYSATAKTDAQLQGGTTLGLVNTNTDDENYAQILFRLNQTNTAIARIVAISESNNNVDLAFVSEGSDNATEKLRIKANGNVGIGTAAPGYKLHIQGGAADDATSSGASIGLQGTDADLVANDDIGTIFFLGNDSTGTPPIVGAYILGAADDTWNSSNANYAPTGIEFHTQDASTNNTLGTARMKIDKDGMVGIGIAPTAQLHVYANDTTAYTATLEQDSTGDSALRFLLTDEVAAIIGIDNTDNNLKFCCSSNALETNTAMKIDASGQIFMPEVYSDTTAADADMVIQSGGQLLRSTSSKRYKKDINYNGVDASIVYNMKPCSFKDKNTDKEYIGLIAEDMHEIEPRLVKYIEIDGKDEPDSIAYGHITAVLVKAIQELSAKVTALESA